MPGAPPFAAGDRVIALTRFGAYASAINVGVAYLRGIPASWSMAQAAASPVQGLTAWYGLVPLGGVQRDAVVLVQSAAGGVGRLLSTPITNGRRITAMAVSSSLLAIGMENELHILDANTLKELT